MRVCLLEFTCTTCMQIPANAKKLAVDPLDRRARELELPDVGGGN